MKHLLKRYRAFLITAAALLLLFLINRDLGAGAARISASTFLDMLMIVPPIFVLLGLLDVWVPRETMVRYMGENAGVAGAALAFLIGSVAAGPLYGAFPVAAVFMKKGVKFSNVLIFIGAWATTKIPMLLFEIAAMGPAFALTRLAVNVPGIIIIALIIEKSVKRETVAALYAKAAKSTE